MKMLVLGAVSSLLVHVSAIVLQRSKDSFGPRHCVKVSKSARGTCVITTDCAGVDTSETEFAFDCVQQDVGSSVVRHSWGVGGFDPSEEFDTGVRCRSCNFLPRAPVKKIHHESVLAKQSAQAPAVPGARTLKAKTTELHVFPKHIAQSAIVKAKSHLATKTAARVLAEDRWWPFTSSEKEKEPKYEKYGPNGCVTVHKSKESHCIMKTDCAKSDISNFEFGLVCVDRIGVPVRHLFGKGSFEPKETFDTLIKCHRCFGLEDIPDNVAVNGEVVALSAAVSGLKDVMVNITTNVQMLNRAVFKPVYKPAREAKRRSKSRDEDNDGDNDEKGARDDVNDDDKDADDDK